MEALLALLFTFGLMYLLLIRPQQRRMRAHQAVVAALEAGDEVVTAGGIHGTITAVDDDSVRVEIAPGVVIRVQRGGISQRFGPFREPEDDEDDDYDEDDEYDDEHEDDLHDESAGAVETDDASGKHDEIVEVVEVKADEITIERPDGAGEAGPGTATRPASKDDDS